MAIDLGKMELLIALRARLEMDKSLGAAFLSDPSGALLKAAASFTARQTPAKSAPAPSPIRSQPTNFLQTDPAPSPSAIQEAASQPRPIFTRLVPKIDAPERPEKEAALSAMRQAAKECRNCGLCDTRHSVVWGEGDLDADVMFVGEAPGRDEDLAGRPFVGRSGKLLTGIIEKGMSLSRGRVYIANTIKCRPPGNRDPLAGEIRACFPYIEKQIEVISPRILVAVGTVAARLLLELPANVAAPRRRWLEYRGIPLRVVYHPSYLLRERAKLADPDARTDADRETWNDIKEIMAKLEELGPKEE
ncbi:MAG: uracil-DNA glycosylase [Planctomycetota bacterium]|jgi:DNA polymerase|nr:uracil-DNA glycosylase [Planctomycetota bacterium]